MPGKDGNFIASPMREVVGQFLQLFERLLFLGLTIVFFLVLPTCLLLGMLFSDKTSFSQFFLSTQSFPLSSGLFFIPYCIVMGLMVDGFKVYNWIFKRQISWILRESNNTEFMKVNLEGLILSAFLLKPDIGTPKIRELLSNFLHESFCKLYHFKEYTLIYRSRILQDVYSTTAFALSGTGVIFIISIGISLIQKNWCHIELSGLILFLFLVLILLLGITAMLFRSQAIAKRIETNRVTRLCFHNICNIEKEFDNFKRLGTAIGNFMESPEFEVAAENNNIKEILSNLFNHEVSHPSDITTCHFPSDCPILGLLGSRLIS